MVKIPQKESKTLDLLDHIRNPQRRGMRIGMSRSGDACRRRLWYGLHWAIGDGRPLPARVHRIFKFGDAIEDLIVADLKAIGYTIYDQQRPLAGIAGHEYGYIDGLLTGVVEAPKAIHLFEGKSMKASIFKQVKKRNNIEFSMVAHYNQCQRYMGRLQMEGVDCQRTLYIAMCKDTSEYHVERIKFDKDCYDGLDRNVIEVLRSETPPIRPFDESWHECRFCDFSGVCHHSDVMDKNCRTCVSVDIEHSGQWTCSRSSTGKALTKEEQMEGCMLHETISNE